MKGFLWYSKSAVTHHYRWGFFALIICCHLQRSKNAPTKLLITIIMNVCIIFAVHYMDNPGLTFGLVLKMTKSVSWQSDEDVQQQMRLFKRPKSLAPILRARLAERQKKNKKNTDNCNGLSVSCKRKKKFIRKVLFKNLISSS